MRPLNMRLACEPPEEDEDGGPSVGPERVLDREEAVREREQHLVGEVQKRGEDGMGRIR